MEELAKTLHNEFRRRLIELDSHWLERTVVLPEEAEKAIVAIGMRRTGKSFTLFQKIKHFLDAGIPLSQILYIDCEDARLQPLDQHQLAQLLDGFYTLFPENHDLTSYLFLDEIHYAEEWPFVIRRYLNTKNARIYLTCSSSKLLSSEIATSLQGRSLTVEVWPYSFQEYLTVKGHKKWDKTLGRDEKDRYGKLLREYLTEGGFPEVVGKPQMQWMRILQDYVSVVTYRDIIERHHITNTALIDYLIHYLLKNGATSFSTNKLFNTLSSQGFSVSRSTLYDYMSYIEDAFLVFTIPVFSESIRKAQNNPKKLYVVDSGLVNAHQLSVIPFYGRLFENLIYLDLRRRGDEIYYYLTEERYEVDFFTRSVDGSLNLYQVAWEMESEETRAREERALEKATQELNAQGVEAKGMIITRDTYLKFLDS